ncbi:archaellar assembly protein FlaJ [Methanohalophilus portucalensis]|uniref:Archaellar assembly protein FlaJ n=2 Tax=Methanohalophilus portucalensis TaxID=39664 RepID=A0A1L9C506_9EURY|nr:archaellar assembly protein FlaJ [Methanohalophilus portucalensis]ATU08270.1 type II secretion protein F [Methanohalophilus portucalensis]OJH49587.1 flagellar assembly protein J [Methanohalophilus portucalensis FDF-1]RNI13563.1 archaellar assembly protein FlaJ [Methanohalophilus portucalensis FDF-1]SMH35289.1 flagellar protein FlaJ [Methanohalophilus portucalensis FDF-1]
MSYRKAFKLMNMEPLDYVKKFALPVIVFGFVFSAIFYIMLPTLFVGNARIIPALVPVLCIIFAVYYPMSVLGGHAATINNNMHYYITQMGVISTADTPRIDIIRIISQNKAYKTLAEESRKIYNLVTVWNLSMSAACRFVSKLTPSIIYQDFLDRFAHGLESGEDIRSFLAAEQNVVMKQYEAMYNSAMYMIEVIKELFVSLVMALIFMASFALIMPVITGMDAVMLMGMVIAIFAMVDVAMLFFTKSKVPKDPIWIQSNIVTKEKTHLYRSIPISLLACLLVAVALMLVDKFPTPIDIAIVVTPLVYTGRIAKKMEKDIRRKDENFPSFIRSLGSSAGARGGMIDDALKALKSHDFGPLTGDVNELYKRLTTRINKFRAWELFAANTGSNLIDRFSKMFIEATNLGGKPDVIGDMIANNFLRIVTLRKKRSQSASSLVGVLYGLTAGIAFTLNISLGVVDLMQDMFTSSMQSPDGVDSGIGMILHTDVGSLETLSLLVLLIIAVHAIISALMIRVVDGGHPLAGAIDFVIMMWIGGGSAVVTEKGIASLLGVT